MELVVYGCAAEEHTQQTECEIFSQFAQSKENTIAIGFDIKQPPICSYCAQRIISLLKSDQLNSITLAFMGGMPTLVMEGIYESIYLIRKQLKCLNIRICDNSLLNDQFKFFLNKLQSVQQFRLKLDGVRLNDENGGSIIQSIAANEAMGMNDKVLELSFSYNMLSEQSCIQLQKLLLRYNNQLVDLTLNLSSNEIYDNQALLISKGIQSCQNLQKLTLKCSECIFDGEGLPNISKHLPNQLEYLSIDYSDNMLGDTQLEQFIENLKKLNPKKVETLILNLSQNELSDIGVKYLAQSLSQFKSLKTLQIGMRGNSISDDSVSVLFTNISLLKQLKDLCLDLSSISDISTLQDISYVINQNSSISYLLLNLADNSLSSKAIETIAHQLSISNGISDLQLNFLNGEYKNLELIFISLLNRILYMEHPFKEISISAQTNINSSLNTLSLLLHTIPLTIISTIMSFIAHQKQLSRYTKQYSSIDMLDLFF